MNLENIKKQFSRCSFCQSNSQQSNNLPRSLKSRASFYLYLLQEALQQMTPSILRTSIQKRKNFDSHNGRNLGKRNRGRISVPWRTDTQSMWHVQNRLTKVWTHFDGKQIHVDWRTCVKNTDPGGRWAASSGEDEPLLSTTETWKEDRSHKHTDRRK